MDKLKEQELIKKCQEEDLDNFGLLYDAYIEKIFNFIYYRTSSQEVAEDLTSQTFFKALKNISKFQGQYFSAWLFRIARNTVIDHYRTSRPVEDIDNFTDLKAFKDLEKETDDKELLSEVKKALEFLKPEQKEIVIMRVWDELSYKEIAEITGKSEANCKMIFSRVVNSLRHKVSFPAILFLLFSL